MLGPARTARSAAAENRGFGPSGPGESAKDGLIEKAQARVLAAQAALDDALADGAPTTDLREVLDLAQSELARLNIEIQGQDAAKLAEDHRAHEAEAKRMVESAKMDLSFALADMGTVSPAEASLPVSIATSLVVARAAQAAHTSKVREHEAVVASLQCRLNGLTDDRAKIINRRAEGRTEPSDGALLALIAADAEGLDNLIRRTEAGGPGADRSGAAERQARWDAEIARERGRILASIAKQMGARLADTLDAIKVNGTGPWPRVPTHVETALRYL